MEDEHEEAGLGLSGSELTPDSRPFLPSGRLRDSAFKLLAVDLDGTLLARSGEPHEADRSAIERLRSAGIPTTIITGRLYSGTRSAANTIGIQGPVGCVDGSQIVDTRSDREVYVRAIETQSAVFVRDLLASHGAASFLFAQDIIVHDPTGEPFAHYVRNWSPRVEIVDRVIEHPHWEHDSGVMAVVALGTSDQIGSIVGTLRSELSHATFVVDFPVARLAGMHALVARAAGTTKGTAVEWFAQHYGISPQEVVVVGDWLNDLPMFKVAGRSFAMGQAPEQVKRHASDRLLSDNVSGGGIAEAIREVWGIL